MVTSNLDFLVSGLFSSVNAVKMSVNIIDSLQFCLTLPSPKERVLKKSEVKVLSFGEDYSQ